MKYNEKHGIIILNYTFKQKVNNLHIHSTKMYSLPVLYLAWYYYKEMARFGFSLVPSKRLLSTRGEATAPHSSTLAWKIPWTEEPGRFQSMGSLRVEHD